MDDSKEFIAIGIISLAWGMIGAALFLQISAPVQYMCYAIHDNQLIRVAGNERTLVIQSCTDLHGPMIEFRGQVFDFQ